MLIEIHKTVLSALLSAFRSRAAVLAENVVLRQQLVVLRRSVAKPCVRARNRVLLALVTRLLDKELKAVNIVRSETVVRWHRSF
jgi:putative transposase